LSTVKFLTRKYQPKGLKSNSWVLTALNLGEFQIWIQMLRNTKFNQDEDQ